MDKREAQSHTIIRLIYWGALIALAIGIAGLAGCGDCTYSRGFTCYHVEGL